MTKKLTVPTEVLANVRRRWPNIAETWALQTEAEFNILCERYRATPRQVLPARYGFVVAVDTSDGPLVLRSSPDPRGREQAAVATALAALGAAPTVHETVTSAHGTWTVLDRIVPGTPLSQVDPEAVDPQALFNPLTLMANQLPPLPDMPSIFDWLRKRLKDQKLADLRPGTTVAPAHERMTALGLLADLARDHVPALCHGDASSGNVIADGSHNWMYIDPRGVVGEHAYDIAVLAIRIADRNNEVGVIARIADIVGLPPDRLRAWMMVAAAARV